MKRLSLVSFLAAVVFLSPGVAFAASSDINIGTVTFGTVTVGAPVTLSASVSSNAGSITTCNLYVDNDDKGAMSVGSGTANMAYTFSNAQIYTVFVFCHDSAGNFNSGPNASVWAQVAQGGGGGYGSDIVPPNVGSMSPAAAFKGVSTAFSVNVSDAGGVASCNLFVSNVDQGAMTIANGVATKSYSFPSSQTYTLYAQCKDPSGNTGTGNNTAVSVSPAPAGSAGTKPGTLIKLDCLAGATADSPCKAVYYYAKDGKRHAFPNDKVFFTWYANFDAVQTVTPEVMASMTLGQNVTYRPGVKMVKFTTVSNVYAVAKGGKLRWIKTETDASALYGSDWSKKIDDISDSFFSSYSFGVDITPSAPFDPVAEMNSATTIDDNL